MRNYEVTTKIFVPDGPSVTFYDHVAGKHPDFGVITNKGFGLEMKRLLLLLGLSHKLGRNLSSSDVNIWNPRARLASPGSYLENENPRFSGSRRCP